MKAAPTTVIKLEHPFIFRCLDPVALLDGCTKLNTFCGRLEKQAAEFADGDEELQGQYKGDGLELFVECLLKSMPMEKRLGISDYKTNNEENDQGVDGSGIGVNGKTATVQVKYRQANYILTANADHLCNFTAQSYRHPEKGGFAVEATPDDSGYCNMLIITTGKELHHFTRDNMIPEVRVVTRQHLRVLIDNHQVFWDSFRSSWEDSLPKKKKKTTKKNSKKKTKKKTKAKRSSKKTKKTTGVGR